MIQHRCRQLRQHGDQPQRKGALTPITRVCVTVESTPSYQYNTAWDTSMHAVAALFDKLGENQEPVITNLQILLVL